VSPAPQPRLLLLSQVYPPDPAAVGQHLHDAAREMVRRGWRVRVLTSARGYADAARRYPARETLDGVDVRRLALGSFGKGSFALRSAGGMLFLARAFLRGVFGSRPTQVLVSTSPPMAPLVGLLLARLRGAPCTFWVMDLNPDQAIATGAVSPRALSARILERANRAAARGSRAVVALDPFMAARVRDRWQVADRLAIIPPWPLEDHVAPVAHAENPFRTRHGLQGKRVVMYSGNLSPVHPIDTILQAAHALRDDARLAFVFIGDGGGRAAVEEAIRRDGLASALLLPYQPLAELRYSLSAADVHLVSMGANMVGIVHPCKVYGAMAAARPLLYLGPRRSHVGELVNRFDIGWHVDHGDVDGAVSALREIAGASENELAARGVRARAALGAELSQQRLLASFCDVLEHGVMDATPSVATAQPHPSRSLP
jgi:glycosyltransferase involved in cell wall biosynthesis